MKDYYAEYLLIVKICKLLEKEQSAKSITEKTKLPKVIVYRILKSLDKHNIVTIRDIRIKDNKHLKLYKIKTNRRERSA